MGQWGRVMCDDLVKELCPTELPAQTQFDTPRDANSKKNGGTRIRDDAIVDSKLLAAIATVERSSAERSRMFVADAVCVMQDTSLERNFDKAVSNKDVVVVKQSWDEAEFRFGHSSARIAHVARRSCG